VDASDGRATLSATNPCIAEIGNTVLMRVASQSVQMMKSDSRGQSAPGSFFICDQLLSFVQGNRTFTSQDFRLLDSFGNAVCRDLPPNTTLDVTVAVNQESALNFNSAFSIFYNNQRVVDFPPRQTTSVNVTSEGSVQASSTFGGNQFPAQLAVSPKA